MQLHEALRDSQPEPRAAHRFARALATVELVEDELPLACRHARAAIADAEEELVAAALRAQPDERARRRIAHRVLHQVPEHLHHARAIDEGGGGTFSAEDLDPLAPL